MELRVENTTSRALRADSVTQTRAHATSRLCSLDEALVYKNDQILYKFQEQWDVTLEEAADLFEEVKKWLWLQVVARQQEGSPPLTITPSLRMLDEMLHTFILFTPEYVTYCDQLYGLYVHHSPMTKTVKDAQAAKYREDPERFVAAEAKLLRDMYAFTAEKLGEATLMKWYAEYPKKYSNDRLAELSKDRFAKVDPNLASISKQLGHSQQAGDEI